MIYLKLFENFDISLGCDFMKIKSDINDIFIDYIDKGFDISSVFYKKGFGMKYVDKNDHCIKVIIKNDTEFKTIDFKEEFIMLNEYIRGKSNNKVDVYYKFFYRYNTMDTIENETYLDTNNNYNVSEIHIFLVERK